MSTPLLLNPGPVTLSARVRDALLRSDLCHREPEFSALQQTIRAKLLAVYDLDPQRWAAILLTGSGTAAVEAMIASCVPHGGKILVIENGVYGERMRDIARAHGIACVSLTHGWGDAIDHARVEQALASDPDITHVGVVHHETTTGRLNALASIAAACAAHGKTILCDAVSSFGAEDLDFDAWPLAACAATANKCLHGVPGTAFVITRRAALAAPGGAARSVYLDLATYLQKQDHGGTPFTPSVQTCYALDAALDEFFEAGGRQARHAAYLRRIGPVRAALVALGIVPLLPAAETSCVLHAFELPAHLDYAGLHAGLKSRGFVIYAGQGALATRLFRISTMGALEAADIERLIAALREVIGARPAK